MRNKEKKRFKIVRKLILGVLIIFTIGIIAFTVAGFIPEKNVMTAAGLKQSSSFYVTMRDGTKINVNLVLPQSLGKEEKIPAVLECTRYATGHATSFVGKAMINLGIIKDEMPVFLSELLKTKHAYVYVQARGSGASFGKRNIEFSKEEINDYGEILDWITEQSWSNGKVGAYGISYMSNTAELTSSLKNPALKAAALLYGDFNPMATTTLPGGLFSSEFLKRFSDGNIQDDNNTYNNLFIKGLKPVDGDSKEKLLKEAVAEHKNNYNVYESMKNITYYDDVISNNYAGESLAPYNYKKQIEEANVPFYVRIGWQDAATVNGALERFCTYKNKQELVIGPWSHGGYYYCDPYIKNTFSIEELQKSQADEVIAFLDQYIKNDADNKKGASQIKYYTYGEEKWKSSDKWPVDGFKDKTLYFDSNQTLKDIKPENIDGKDSYKVDFSSTSGKSSRWQTNYGGGEISYKDMKDRDKKLLTYTSEVLEKDVEITGVPVVTLNLASTAEDGAFITYLEDVSPNGEVTYITEGELRAIHRNISNKDLGYNVVGPEHSFEKKDGKLLISGQNTELKIGMQATSVLIKKGHKIRIAITGSDIDNFDNICEKEAPTIEVQRNSINSSYVELPVKYEN